MKTVYGTAWKNAATIGIQWYTAIYYTNLRHCLIFAKQRARYGATLCANFRSEHFLKSREACGGSKSKCISGERFGLNTSPIPSSSVNHLNLNNLKLIQLHSPNVFKWSQWQGRLHSPIPGSRSSLRRSALNTPAFALPSWSKYDLGKSQTHQSFHVFSNC